MDRDIISRKLGPVYNAIDGCDFKTAIKLCERKDIEKVPLARALKAYSLIRRSRVDEGILLARGVVEQGMLDETLVSTLMLVFRQAGCDVDCTLLYEKAFRESNEKNVEYGERLWFTYMRTYDFANAQLLGMKLGKAFSTTRYFGWAGAAILANANILAENGNSAEASKKMVFAEALLQKAFAGIKQGAERNSICLLYIDALRMRNKWDEAISFAEAKLDDLQARERLLILAELYEKQGNSTKAADLYLKLLKDEDPNDWRNWCGFVDCALDHQRPDILGEMTPLLTDTAGRPRRGPNLAVSYYHYRVMLAALHKNKSHDESACSQFSDSIYSYLEKFDIKACCFGDLRNMLMCFLSSGNLPRDLDTSTVVDRPPSPNPIFFGKTLGETLLNDQLNIKRSRRWPMEAFSCLWPAGCGDFSARVLARCEEASSLLKSISDIPEKKKLVHRIITCHKVLRFIGKYETFDESQVVDLVNEMVTQYNETLTLDEDAQGGQREVKIGDDLILLASHLLVDLANQTGTKARLLQAAALLEQAHEHSPYGFQLALGLIEIYSRLGSMSRVSELYNHLDVKHIQTDSLTHIVLGRMISHGYFDEALGCCDALENLWLTSRRENPDYMRKALQLGNVSKLLEFLRLDRMLNDSHQRSVTVTESYSLKMLREEHLESWQQLKEFIIRQEKPRLPKDAYERTRMVDVRSKDLGKLTSNYDFTVAVSCDCPLGKTAMYEFENVDTSETAAKTQHRACTSQTTYDKKWHERARMWLEYRLLLSDILSCAVGESTDGGVALDDPRSEEFTQFVKALWGRDGKLSSPIWDALILAIRATLLIAHVPEPTNVAKHYSAIVEILTSLNECLQKCSQTKNAPVQSLATILPNAVICIAVCIRSWTDSFPTKKKKKKKANPSAEEAALEQLQKCVKSCMNTLALLAESYKEDLRERIDKIDEDGSQDLKWQGELPIQLRQARKVSKSLVSSERDIAGRLLQISTGIKTLVKVKY
uniref:Uncharacterized protein n=2 Tax=Mucochytrium quahogii TaxID=96639 RepID=A0A7S2SM01_9STRA|mmetsp:Transcript_8023/g.17620  ORF Transcript_8023/g.17620 Transcript_8023/m.17620 type:complete len:995 (+) Transcript_8023:216-3200(+)